MNEQNRNRIIIDDMFLTVDVPTTAGSKILEGYQSPTQATAITKAQAAGYVLLMKTPVGEFAIDLLGETAVSGAWGRDGIVKNLTAEMLWWENDAKGAFCLDVNGYPRRAAAQMGLVCLKPTHGAISREGIVSVAASGETVDILAKTVEDCRELFDAIAEDPKKEDAPIRRVAVFSTLDFDMDGEVKQKINTAVSNLQKNGISVTYIENSILAASKAAWNIILCAEFCKSTARYDGVRYGYRTKDFATLDELYTNSRTEGFGDLVKAAILYGSETLSAQNYQTVYEKALRVRRVIADEFAKLFEDFDAILLPACSQMVYTEEQIDADKYIAFEENRYTAPATLAGLPAVVSGGVQLIGKANAEHALLDVANILTGEGR
jgi:aspartyl-tRNA(Asn)/glutamyl-tRNA(Gln) amidotransferase subunit A